MPVADMDGSLTTRRDMRVFLAGQPNVVVYQKSVDGRLYQNALEVMIKRIGARTQ